MVRVIYNWKVRVERDSKRFIKVIRDGVTLKSWKFIDVEGVKTLHLNLPKCKKLLDTNALYL